MDSMDGYWIYEGSLGVQSTMEEESQFVNIYVDG